MSSTEQNHVASSTGLTAQQLTFFKAFGFVHLPGLFASDVARLERGFEEAFQTDEVIELDPENELHNTDSPDYASKLRSMVFGFIERSPDLVWLHDDPRLIGVVESILGPRWEYCQSDGNRFNCDVSFHSDMYGSDISIDNLKCYFYLDPLTRETGALRVFPGTHHADGIHASTLRGAFFNPLTVEERFGTAQRDLPSHAIETNPGDLIVGNFRTLHGSFGGAPGRRLFTVNFRERT